MPRLRIATCRPLPEPDVDEPVLLEALALRGVDAEMVAWDDPTSRWDGPGPIVIRSTWNYHLAPSEFLAWVDRVGGTGTLYNPPEVVRANWHKRYLCDLDARGVPIVPTVLLERGSSVILEAVMRERDWRTVVVKPAVSAASHGTRRFDRGSLAAARAHLADLVSRGDALVQPYMTSVDDQGERSLVWIDGVFTHAVRKSPRLTGDDESVSGAVSIEDDERRVAEAALTPWVSRLLYARVDLVRDESGAPRVMEVEMIEPSLFLQQSGGAVERLATAMARLMA